MNACFDAATRAAPAVPPIVWPIWIAAPTDCDASAAAVAGRPASAPDTCEANDDASTLPRIATPRAPPIWRVVSFIAEPTPAFASGREPMIDSVAGAIAVPMPSAEDQSATSTCG